MSKRSKRYVESKKIVDSEKKYELKEAVKLLKSFKRTKFDASVEVAMKLGIDPKQSDQLIRGSVSLPKGIGRSLKVIVFAAGEKAVLAKNAGADEVGAEELVKKVEGGWADFDVAIATSDMMRFVGKLGRVLGPQGKMPSPKSGTVTDDIGTAVKEFKAGKIEYRTDAGGNVHSIVGKVSFSEKDLEDNINAFVKQIVNSRPASAKGIFIEKVSVSSTMSPGIMIEV
ncbi:MAG: 50S ribosomal protein L1 [Planctomycetia bacterium]|uniref:Large ribosomal subunit protein uL1 n=1 Tax=Candidatus Brocadia sapporoensis TaxID=392547 RepID=A0A1V6M1H4_9BACT|nr:50S ribosomal protein L1 [Candidatus Brocadia sapporoensis]MCC7240014.1 50S ribosomal protein L1 [Candidatus Brocadia sp.]QOJ06955.1 MAG: 50S ribosomal protein L1 [Planctomycetia bacterium]TVL94847.1 MAG: 50S ribosomal protein L1 [Candidatus Brocadia sp. BL1]MDG6006543.1 50S ribosomal protein L1 [Candidatus Brocadia sp.]OQD46252.1 50S ribosomal protein L1 [Candidatus Brocadia sapporoensis]